MRKLKRHFRRRWPVYLALASILGSLVLFVGMSFGLEMFAAADSSPSHLTSFERCQANAFRWILVFWFFVFGATVGSYLNVVAYRVPRGESVALRPSHCPYCDRKIVARDNLPVLGWIALNGRCRKCRLPISRRYPSVEFFCGCLYLIYFFVEAASGGANLPAREINERTGIAAVVVGAGDLLALYFWHMFLAATLVAGTLIHWDRQRLPIRFWAIPLGIG